MTPQRILIACIGNIFLGDDAFGVEVAARLLRLAWPAGVRVEDFGIRGVDLAYCLLEGNDVTIFVDTVQRGQPPGTLYVIEPDLAEFTGGAGSGATIDAHTMDPANVLRNAVSMGATPGRILLVGCEPGPMPPDDQMQLELSPAVAAAVSEAVPLIQELVARILAGELQSTEANKELSSC